MCLELAVINVVSVVIQFSKILISKFCAIFFIGIIFNSTNLIKGTIWRVIIVFKF